MTNPTTDDMAREVYEAITGKCWHVIKGYPYYCDKCGEREINPPLSTSIDAWHEHIFPVMSDEQEYAHHCALSELTLLEDIFTWRATAMHHLQAAWAMIKGGK